MTQHIKSGFVILALLFLSCSSNNVLESNKQVQSGFDQVGELYENFAFFKSFQFCDNPYAAFTEEEARNIYQNKRLQLDLTKEGESVDWNAFFYEGAKECIEQELGEKQISSSLVTTSEDFPFDQLVLFNQSYVIVAQDGYFFVFKGFREGDVKTEKSTLQGKEELNSSESSLKPVVKALKNAKTVSLPREYSYEFAIELTDFTTIDDVPEISGLDHLTDFQFAKLPSFGKTEVLLVSGLLDSGQSELYLLSSVGSSYKLADKLLLYTHRETEDGGILTRFKINKDYQITVSQEENANGSKKLLEEKHFQLNSKGEFVKSN